MEQEKANMAARYEHEIPEGYEARIDGNKVIIELKESEDERIRKDIITTLSIGVACDESALHPGACTTLKEALAYLEKQKEQKPAEYITITQKILDYIDKDSKKYENKRPVLGDVWAVTKKHTFPNVFNGKPVVEVEKDGFGWMRLPEEIVELKNEQNKPAEWSEEDRYHIERILQYLQYYKTYTYPPDESIEKERIWLKSLRPQPHWKPSEEQMNALKVVARGYPSDDLNAIESLLNDLQKLL